MTPSAIVRINKLNLTAVIVLASALFAWIVGSAVVVKSKAEAIDVIKNTQDIAVLRAQEDSNSMDHMRIEAKLDKLVDHLLEGD